MLCFRTFHRLELQIWRHSFDFDGTLVDSAPDLTRALDSALARAGLPGVGLELGTKMVGQARGKLVEHALCHVTQI